MYISWSALLFMSDHEYNNIKLRIHKTCRRIDQHFRESRLLRRWNSIGNCKWIRSPLASRPGISHPLPLDGFFRKEYGDRRAHVCSQMRTRPMRAAADRLCTVFFPDDKIAASVSALLSRPVWAAAIYSSLRLPLNA